MRWLTIHIPTMMLLGLGTVLLLAGHELAGGFLLFFGIMSTGTVTVTETK